MARGEWDLGDLIEAVLDFMGFDDAMGDFVDEELDEGRIQDAIDESMMEMESMSGNAGQDAILEEVFAVWEDNCWATVNGGPGPATLTERDIGRDKADAIEEILAEGEAIVMEAID